MCERRWTGATHHRSVRSSLKTRRPIEAIEPFLCDRPNQLERLFRQSLKTLPLRWGTREHDN